MGPSWAMNSCRYQQHWHGFKPVIWQEIVKYGFPLCARNRGGYSLLTYN